ncbi:MAG: hypothetical protein F9K13_01970 [Candidatus Methylomirabilis oxygeniifera]|uniref:Nucleotidyl transferase AbiEii/AbiGii toxin family protein n=1 Tax=Methylomirabilis oxygeniifera TaxID=671143 RepID=D5MLT6_METO1|nr:MAG: hypothetical protein F9K13_01970 [Candidatus Methylomirabilis oxyfera]CBE69993.1 protein of unknown function [Candidatus Methylomirabilis oxyfera]
MIPPLEAAWEVHRFLTKLGFPYALIGGLAVQYWGEPRLTVDADVTVSAPLNDPETFVRTLIEHFPSRIDDPIAFARRSRMVLIRTSNNCPVDVSLALPGYEDEVMRRVVSYELEPDKAIRLCSAEDLIVHKAVASRPQDLRDIEGVIARRHSALDVAYIRRWLTEFADILADPELLQRFERPWQRLQTFNT